jgi:hypothetical protein
MGNLVDLGFFLMILGLIFYGPITAWIILREIRKMAETLPESRREEWIKEALKGVGKGLENKDRKS